jgi:ATP-dependent DNA ligase
MKKAGPVLRFSEHLDGEHGEAMFRHAYAMGLDGIVSKKGHGPLQVGGVQELAPAQNPAYERRTGA